MSDGVSRREFAKHIGRSHVWVMQLIKEGHLPQNEDGTIPLEAGLNAYEAFMNAPKKPRGRPSKNGTKGRADLTMGKKKDTKKEKKHIPLEVYEEEKAQRTQDAVNINAAMNKAKLAETTFRARLREIEFKMKSGELLEKTEVIAEAQWVAEQVKSKLLAIPPRIASICEGRPAREIEEIITDSINHALSELQKCKYKKGE